MIKGKMQKYTASNIQNGIEIAKELSLTNSRKFIESLDVAIKLRIDPKQSSQSVKGSIVFPGGLGKNIKVIFFSDNDEQNRLAIEHGATHAGCDNLISMIENGFSEFDYCIATPDVMTKINRIAKKLGPKGIMPSQKNGTITTNIKEAILDAIKGKSIFKNDKGGTIHCQVGKVNFDTQILIKNMELLVEKIKESKPENFKGKFLEGCYISTTMGPSIRIINL